MLTFFENLQNAVFGKASASQQAQMEQEELQEPTRSLLDPSILHEAYKNLGHSMVERLEVIPGQEWHAIENNSRVEGGVDPNVPTLGTLVRSGAPEHKSPLEYILEQLNADNSSTYPDQYGILNPNYGGNHIYICGDGGAGKTELLQTIAGEWARGTSEVGKALRAKYDYVFYAPLEKLTQRRWEDTGLADVIWEHLHEHGAPYISEVPEGATEEEIINLNASVFSKMFVSKYRSSENYDTSKILVLFDGYDRALKVIENHGSIMLPDTNPIEVSRIVAVRPVVYANRMLRQDCFPCRLELVGLTRQEDIVAYIEQRFSGSILGERAIEFITSNPALLELCRLPLQLKWICNKINELSASEHESREVQVSDIYNHVLESLIAYYKEYSGSTLPIGWTRENAEYPEIEWVREFVIKLAEVAGNEENLWHIIPDETLKRALAPLEEGKPKIELSWGGWILPTSRIRKGTEDAGIIRILITENLNPGRPADRYFICPSMQKHLAGVLEPGTSITLPYLAESILEATSFAIEPEEVPASEDGREETKAGCIEPKLAERTRRVSSYTQQELLVAAMLGMCVSYVFVGIPSLPQATALIAANIVGVEVYNLLSKAKLIESRISQREGFSCEPSVGSVSGATFAHVGLIVMGIPATSLLGCMAIVAMVALGVAVAPKFMQKCRENIYPDHPHQA